MARQYVDISALPRLLVRPRSTLEELRPHTGPLQGAFVALVLIVVAGVVDALVRWTISMLGSGDVHRVGLLSRFPSFTGVVLAFLAFLLLAALVFNLVARWGKARRPDAGTTVGLLGYAMFPVVILGIVISILLAYFGGQVGEFVDRTGSLAEDYSGWDSYWWLYYLLLLVTVLLGVRYQAKAASVANDSAGGRTLALTAVAWIISLVILVLVVEVWSLLSGDGWVDLPLLPFL